MVELARAVEIWVPSKFGGLLELSAGYYGNLAAFAKASRHMRFRAGEGLPGKAWKTQLPLMTDTVTKTFFKRTQAASAAGLTCGLAMPYFRDSWLGAVVLIFFGSREPHFGGVEIWAETQRAGSRTVKLQDCYYGSAEIADWHADHVVFDIGGSDGGLPWRTEQAPGDGLPGSVLATRKPGLAVGMPLGALLARDPASRIELGVGLPWVTGSAAPTMVALYSCAGTPICRRVEVWQRGAADEPLALVDQAAAGNAAFTTAQDQIVATFDAGLPRLVVPAAADGAGLPPDPTGGPPPRWVLTLPVVDGDPLTACVVALYG